MMPPRLRRDAARKRFDRPFGGIGMFGDGGENTSRDALDIAGLKVLSEHGRDDLVVGTATYCDGIFGAVKDRVRAEERG